MLFTVRLSPSHGVASSMNPSGIHAVVMSVSPLVLMATLYAIFEQRERIC